jgi:hypothetical protein
MDDGRNNLPIRLVGFDGDDTLWRSEDYYRAARVVLG